MFFLDREELTPPLCEMSYMYPSFIPVPSYVVKFRPSRILENKHKPNEPVNKYLRDDSARKLAHARYSLYLYRDRYWDEIIRFDLEGTTPKVFYTSGTPKRAQPILFVHGNAGSHGQIRSLASRASTLREDPNTSYDITNQTFPLHFYASMWNLISFLL
jgi:hypothetical protein